jgi:hypothetical protein
MRAMMELSLLAQDVPSQKKYIQSNLSDEPVQTYELKDDGVC